MHPETQDLISRFRNYTENRQPFVWNTENRGGLNCWNLLLSEGFVQTTDFDQVIATWKGIARRGMPTDPKEYPGYKYASSRRERKDDSWSPYLQSQQNQYYNALAYFLKSSLQNLRAYSLRSINRSLNVSWAQEFKIFIIVGQTSDLEWICLAPTVPDQVWNRYTNSFHPELASLTACQSTKPVARDIHEKISKVLVKLKPIECYGYYDYVVYNHQIFCTMSSEEPIAIELALKAGKMFDDDPYYFKVKYDGDSSEKPVTQFMRNNFQQIQRYMFCFWDVGYGYKFGLTEHGDWVGLKYLSYMDYNP
ncbi:hypothetical protein [Nostoc sp.]|uniref:hypothetical protein n=1 Tax=Nostoc sp. TaxID=1180 RepID=UPI002FF69F89